MGTAKLKFRHFSGFDPADAPAHSGNQYRKCLESFFHGFLLLVVKTTEL
jgi:hypothetical protein